MTALLAFWLWLTGAAQVQVIEAPGLVYDAGPMLDGVDCAACHDDRTDTCVELCSN
jgi:hypothetical protein